MQSHCKMNITILIFPMFSSPQNAVKIVTLVSVMKELLSCWHFKTSTQANCLSNGNVFSKESNLTKLTLTSIKRVMPEVEHYLNKRSLSVNMHLVAHASVTQTHLLYYANNFIFINERKNMQHNY